VGCDVAMGVVMVFACCYAVARVFWLFSWPLSNRDLSGNLGPIHIEV